jgi:tetratricopeptide (TPR) repeat protein
VREVLAKAYRALGRSRDAAASWAVARSLRPDRDAEYAKQMGMAYFEVGEYEAARDLLEHAAKTLPDDRDIAKYLGWLHDIGR